MTMSHQNRMIYCLYLGCGQIFHTNLERCEHVVSSHLSMSRNPVTKEEEEKFWRDDCTEGENNEICPSPRGTSEITQQVQKHVENQQDKLDKNQEVGSAMKTPMMVVEIKVDSEREDNLTETSTKKKLAKRSIKRLANPQKQNYACMECGKKYKNKKKLLKHELVHAGTEDYTHLNTQQAGKSLKCEKCGKKFIKRGSFTKHVLKHGLKPTFECEQCPLKFSDDINLKSHIRNVHERKEGVACHCGKIFLTQLELTRHTRVHTGEKPYKCEVCEDRFSQNNNCRRHMKRMHGLDVLRTKKTKTK